MTIHIRQEKNEDIDIIYNLVKKSFENAKHSDGTEQDLVNRLRKSKSFISELSLVATDGNNIIGHILFTKILIENNNKKAESLALAPLAVLPEYQNKSVGSKLVKEGLKIAKELGYKSVIVLGSENYYPRFGFVEAKNFKIIPPFEVPSENFMAIELEEDSLKDISGTVIYSKEFFEN